MTFKKFKGEAFLKTPFHPYVRPAQNQDIHVTTLVNYYGGRQNMVANKREIQRTLSILKMYVPELEDIFREAISIFPENKDMFEKLIQTTEMFKRKIREFRRAMPRDNRVLDIMKIRQLTAAINENIEILHKSVGILKHRVTLQTANSPLLIMIEDFQFGFPNFMRLNLGGESTQQSMQGIKIYFHGSLCIKKLCLNNISAAIVHLDGNRCGSQQVSVETFYVSGKASRMMSLSPSGILTISGGHSVNMAFGRNSEHLSIGFEASICLLDLNQTTNATLDKTQLSLKVKGKIFKQYPTQMNIVAKIKDIEDWSSLVYSVEGKMTKSSILPSYFQEKINKYALALAEKGQRRIQNAETEISDAKNKTKEAEQLLKASRLF